MAQKDVVEVDRGDGAVKKHRRFDDRDWKYLAEFVIQEWEKRKTDRKDRELHWKEVDRQVAMEPEVSFKKLPDGTIDAKKAWMAEMELPLQAQALEVLTADARRMMFPDSGPWFRANVELTDEYLRNVNFASIIHGDEMQVPSEINQDNADKLAAGFLLHHFSQYDHSARFDMINAECFKYGMGVGRGRLEKKNVYIHEARGVRKDNKKIPIIAPCSVKNLYLDDPKPSMHSSQVLGPAHIAHDYIRYENIAIAANKGSNNPEDEDGGWMPDQLKKVAPDKKGYVQILEMEGDIIVPRKTVRSVVIPGAILTVALGGVDGGGSATKAVIRFRFRKYPFSSYILFPYHYEGANDAYPTSPLMKGRPVQMMATDALNRLTDSAMLKCLPPVGYDANNVSFAQTGGPEIYPSAQWPTIDPVMVYNQIGGDVGALAGVLSQAINLYAELTGVLPARVGAQTNSHTTAYAKQTELQRGATRTVDYVNSSGHGPVTRWLDMAYRMGRDAMTKNEEMAFYIKEYGGFVSVTKEMMPEDVHWEWFGSGGPAEQQQKSMNKLNSLQLAVKVDQMGLPVGRKPRINLDEAVAEILREGGWVDLEKLISGGTILGSSAPHGAAPAPGLPGPPQGSRGAPLAALQDLSGAGG